MALLKERGVFLFKRDFDYHNAREDCVGLISELENITILVRAIKEGRDKHNEVMKVAKKKLKIGQYGEE